MHVIYFPKPEKADISKHTIIKEVVEEGEEETENIAMGLMAGESLERWKKNPLATTWIEIIQLGSAPCCRGLSLCL